MSIKNKNGWLEHGNYTHPLTDGSADSNWSHFWHLSKRMQLVSATSLKKAEIFIVCILPSVLFFTVKSVANFTAITIFQAWMGVRVLLLYSATDGQMACARNIISHIPKWIIIIMTMMCGQKVAAVSDWKKSQGGNGKRPRQPFLVGKYVPPAL